MGKKIKHIIILTIIWLILFSGSLNAVNGLIKEVDQEKNSLKIKNKWYYLQENTIIERNNTKVNLKSCKPVQDKYKQWARLKFDDKGNIDRVEVQYKIIEGKIIEINREKGTLILKIFKNSSEQTNSNKISNIREDLIKSVETKDKVVIIKSGPEIIDLKKV